VTPSAIVAAPEPEAPGTADATPCGRCGRAIDAQAWRALPLVEAIPPERLRELVTRWPSGARVEVRRCACGRALGRKVAPDGARS
jgi:hypothetical protein